MFKRLITILLVVVSFFAFGCESKQEKFDKLEKELVAENAAAMHEVQKAADAKDYQKMMDLADKNIAEIEKKVKQLEDVAKGDKALETKASEKRIWHEQQKILLEQGRKSFQKAGVIK
jgi:hypothetical protein